MIYILNKNKTRVIFVQVVLESWAAMFGYVITEAFVGNSFANYPIHIQILYKTKNNKEKYNKI
jgi:hypothetical protein